MPDPTRLPGSGPSRYLPRWVSATTESDSLLFQLLDRLAGQADPVAQEIARAQAYRWVPALPLGDPYRQWVAPFAASPREDLRLVLTTASGSGVIRRAATPHDFTAATDPVWWPEPETARLLLRNLATKETPAVSATGVYTISGEASGFLSDQDVYYRYASQTRWERWPCESLPASGVVLTLPASGSLVVRYGSQARLTELSGATLQVLGGDRRSVQLDLILDPFPNILDGYGQLLGLPRLRGEDNREYRERLLLFLQSPPDTTVGGLLRRLGAAFGQLGLAHWDGVTTLTLDDGGLALQEVRVLEVARYQQYEEELLPDPDGSRFYAHTGGWRGGAGVWVAGLPRQDYSLSGQVVTFTTPVSGRVTARYTVEQFSFTRDTSGNILTLVPGHGLPSGQYRVLYTGRVKAFGLDQPEFQVDYLLTAEGLPNRLYLELATQLVRSAPHLLAQARWGGAVWTSRAEVPPHGPRLALAFDDS